MSIGVITKLAKIAEKLLVDAGIRPDLADYIDPAKGAGVVGRAIRHINSMSELKTVTGRYTGETIFLTQFTTGSGVGSGHFMWDGESVLADNIGIVIQATGVVTGRWIREKHRQFALVNFGADPTGAADSSAAVQACLSALPAVQTIGVDKNIFVDGLFKIAVGGITVVFEKAWGARFIGQGLVASQFEYTGAATVMLDLPSSEIRFNGIRFLNSSGGTRTAVKTRLVDGRADCDIYFDSCGNYAFSPMHHCFGRGHVDTDCSLGGGGTMLLVESPDPFTEGASPGVQAVKTGMRRYVSENAMIDSALYLFEFSPNGPAADYINEVTIIGTNGHGLSKLVSGGFIRDMLVRTGELVNSFSNAWAIDVRGLIKGEININAKGWYNPDIAPTVGINGLLRANKGLVNSDTLIGNVRVGGNISPLAQALITTDGKIGNVNVESLMLPDAYTVTPLGSVIFVAAGGGIEANAKLNINNVSFSGATYAASTFRWALASQIPDSQVEVGQYSKGLVPILPFMRNKGTATVLSGTNSITVAHGMGVTPLTSDVMISPLINDYTRQGAWISSATSVNITIQCGATIASDTAYAWSIDRSVR